MGNSSIDNQDYLQHVVAVMQSFFAPLEQAIQTMFIPVLLWIQPWEIDGGFGELLMHIVKEEGLVLRNPVDTALYVHDASKLATFNLTQSQISDEVHFVLRGHIAGARAAESAGEVAMMGRE